MCWAGKALLSLFFFTARPTSHQRCLSDLACVLVFRPRTHAAVRTFAKVSPTACWVSVSPPTPSWEGARTPTLLAPPLRPPNSAEFAPVCSLRTDGRCVPCSNRSPVFPKVNDMNKLQVKRHIVCERLKAMRSSLTEDELCQRNIAREIDALEMTLEDIDAELADQYLRTMAS
jgi:hypothetical protein